MRIHACMMTMMVREYNCNTLQDTTGVSGSVQCTQCSIAVGTRTGHGLLSLTSILHACINKQCIAKW